MSQWADFVDVTRAEAGPSGRARVLAVALTCGLLTAGLLSACSSSTPDPVSSPSVAAPAATPRPTQSESPTPEPVAAPVRPAGMDRTDEVGAAAAATYFMELYAYSMRTGDLSAWEQLSGQTCQFCALALADVRSAYEAGGRYEGGELTVGEAVLVGKDDSIGAFAVQVPFAFAQGAQIGSEGEVIRRIAAEEGTAVLDVAPSVRGWLLLEGSEA